MPAVVACRCGQRFLAQDNLLGRQVPCPACGSPLFIPAPQAPAGGFDVLSVDPSLTGGQVPQPQWGHPGSRPLGQVVSPPGADDWSQAWLIGGLVGGGIGLVVLVIAIAVAFSGGGSGPAGAVAKRPAPRAPAAPPPVVARRPAPPPFVRAPNVRVRPAPPVVPPIAPATSAPSSSPAVVDAPDFGQPPGDSPDFGKPSSPASGHSLAQLPPALQSWHGSTGTRLTGLFKGGDAENAVTNVSWLAGLLPFLGYQREYERLALHKPITDSANLTVGHVLVTEFQNPLDSRKKWEGYPFDGLALTHFVGMSGVEDARNVCAAQLPRTDPRAGVFGYDAVATPQEITDGASQTIMVVGSGRLANPWLLGGGATIRGAREPLFDNISGLGTEGLPVAGTLAVMADGSVRAIPKTIDPNVFKAMCTIHGRESVDLEAAAPQLPIETFK